jgi:8-oxo-dGTP diphosphatase
MKNYLAVAAGVILNSHGEVLLALRPLDKHQGGLWEFPGGKIEAGERVHEALARELREEIGIEIFDSTPLLEKTHEYTDKSIHLSVHLVRQWSGIPDGKEGQELRWIAISNLQELKYPEANLEVVDYLQRRHDLYKD